MGIDPLRTAAVCGYSPTAIFNLMVKFSDYKAAGTDALSLCACIFGDRALYFGINADS